MTLALRASLAGLSGSVRERSDARLLLDLMRSSARECAAGVRAGLRKQAVATLRDMMQTYRELIAKQQIPKTAFWWARDRLDGLV